VRVGSLGDDVIGSVLDNQARLDRIKTQLLDSFEATYKSVREEVAVRNRDNMFLMIVNFLGGELFIGLCYINNSQMIYN